MSDLQARLQAALGDAYRVERELGGGGMSRVFLAQEAALGRRVVVKVLPRTWPRSASALKRNEGSLSTSPEARQPHVVVPGCAYLQGV